MRYPKTLLDALPASAYYSSHHIGSSLMKLLLPEYADLDFWYQSWMNPARPNQDDEKKEALHIGRAMHQFILEPDVFKVTYQIKTGVKTSTMPNTIGQGQFDDMQRMRDTLFKHKFFAQLIQGGKPEVSMFWEHEETKTPCRGRLDYLQDFTVVDLKFVQSVSRIDIPYIVANYHYDMQAAMYLDGIKRTTGRDDGNFVLVFQEKAPPFKVVARIFEDDVLQVGRAKYEDCCHRFAKNIRDFGTNEWPAFPEKVERLSASDMPPSWAFR